MLDYIQDTYHTHLTWLNSVLVRFVLLYITECLCYKWPRKCYMLIVVITIPSYSHLWIIIGIVSRLFNRCH